MGGATTFNKKKKNNVPARGERERDTGDVTSEEPEGPTSLLTTKRGGVDPLKERTHNKRARKSRDGGDDGFFL